MVAWLYEFYVLVVKDNILPIENKIPISAPPCNVLYRIFLKFLFSLATKLVARHW